MSAELKAEARSRIEHALNDYMSDLRAMNTDLLAKAPGSSARSPFDFTFEVALVNRRVAARLRKEDPGPWHGEGWLKAPSEFCVKDEAIRAVEESGKAVLSSWDAWPAESLNEKITLPNGETTPLEMANLIARHLVYHDAQLNYCQALSGDEEVHWQR